MNALMRLYGSTDANLTDVEKMILAESEQDQAAYDAEPVYIRVAPGGIGQFVLGDETAKGFNAIVVLSQKNRGYWPEASTGAPPLCASQDGLSGVFNALASDSQIHAAKSARLPHPAIPLLDAGKDIPARFSCATCPMNQWGSMHQRKGGTGKACKEMRRLFLVPEGWTVPAVFMLPPTSVKAWDAYCSKLSAKRSAYFAVITRFSLGTEKARSGETYNTVQVDVAGEVKDLDKLAAVQDLRAQYRQYVSAAPVVDGADNGDGGNPFEAEQSIPF